MWYAYLLHYLEVQCTRTLILPRAVIELFPFECHFYSINACPEDNFVITSENDFKLGMHICCNISFVPKNNKST